jgi:hypothetical protein
MRPNLIRTLALVSCLALAGSARAQDEDAFAPASEAHRPGRWSMQFQLVENFQFRAFEGAGLAMTRNAGTNSAWRFGVSLNGDFSGFDRTFTASDSSVSEVWPVDSDRYSVRLDLLRLRRYHPARRVGLELGVGPTVDQTWSQEELDIDSPPLSFRREVRSSRGRYGLIARLGVEVFLARALSIHAHYGASGGYEQFTAHQHTIYTQAGETFENEFHQHRWFLEDEGASLGISVYL